MISIIVPVYNSVCYLKDCLSSVLKQTYQDFEILLIDDGSKDNGLEICGQFVEKDSRIRCYTQKHQGVSAARNRGLDLARGEYIFFLDSDDLLNPFILEVLYEQIQLFCADMSFCLYQEEEFTKKSPSVLEYHVFKRNEIAEQFSKKNRLFGGIGGKLIKNEAIGGLRFEEDLYLGEDTLFLYELTQKGISAVYTTDRLYYYRKHSRSLSGSNITRRGILSYCQVVKRIENSEQKAGRTENAYGWEGEYVKALRRAMQYLPKRELYQMRGEVIKEWKNPHFRLRPLRTKGMIFLAFFCYPVFSAVCAVKHAQNGGKNDKNI